jgi:hypothetical protein
MPSRYNMHPGFYNGSSQFAIEYYQYIMLH